MISKLSDKEFKHINSLPNNIILDWTKLQAFTDKLNVAKNDDFTLHRAENTVWQRENVG